MQPAESQHIDNVTQTTSGLIGSTSEAQKSWASFRNAMQQGSPRGGGKKGPQTSCNEGFFAHLDGCLPHTEELRRSDSPSVFSIAVTICGGQKTESLTFCQGKEKELVTLAPTLFTPKNAKQGRKLFRCSDLSTGGKPARPALHRQSWAELQDSSPGPEECHKNNMT